MSDNLHYNSQKDKDMDERLSNPIEEILTCKNCGVEYAESESHECEPIVYIDKGIYRLTVKLDEYGVNLKAAAEAVDKLVKRNAVLEKALAFNRIAHKLSLKEKEFICIAIDEPYFSQAFFLIRKHEMDNNTWTDGDECWYDEMITKNINIIKQAGKKCKERANAD